MNTSLALLSYNEVDGLKHFLPLIGDICENNGLAECFAVDGGSEDGSLELYKKYNIPFYIQEKKGRGEAFKVAFKKSTADAIIFFSPDGNEDIRDIAKFCSLISDGAEIVIASRMSKEAVNEEDKQFFKWRKWANQTFTFLANSLWNRNNPFVTDSINGYRAFRRSAWKKLNISASDYTIEYQSTIRAMKRKLSIAEFPTIEGQRIGGESYAKSIPTGLRFLKLLFKEIAIGTKF